MNCCQPVVEKPKPKPKPVYTGCGSATSRASHMNLLRSEPTEVVKEGGKTVQIYHF